MNFNLSVKWYFNAFLPIIFKEEKTHHLGTATLYKKKSCHLKTSIISDIDLAEIRTVVWFLFYNCEQWLISTTQKHPNQKDGRQKTEDRLLAACCHNYFQYLVWNLTQSPKIFSTGGVFSDESKSTVTRQIQLSHYERVVAHFPRGFEIALTTRFAWCSDVQGPFCRETFFGICKTYTTASCTKLLVSRVVSWVPLHTAVSDSWLY